MSPLLRTGYLLSTTPEPHSATVDLPGLLVRSALRSLLERQRLGTDGTHRDESTILRLDGIAHR
jgi:hypothetical protein